MPIHDPKTGHPFLPFRQQRLLRVNRANCYTGPPSRMDVADYFHLSTNKKMFPKIDQLNQIKSLDLSKMSNGGLF